MAQLLGELDIALEGEGRAWLIAGESGVGKSRLLDDLRVHALVGGANVLRGQAISEGGNPYQVWGDVLYRLCVLADVTSVEASILLPIEPKLAGIAGGDLPLVPELDSGAAQDRMFRTIERIFARTDTSLLLILSDLQWADDESLQLLARLLPIVNQKLIMPVGDYRDDERPRLTETLPGMNVLKLKRLDAQGVEDVLSSMLGNVGHNPELIGLLERETKGNMFFLLEVIRALAEEAGQLDQITTMRLPEKVVTGGVQAIIDRRLSLVQTSERPLLNLAAVAGRQLDVAVLKQLAPVVDFDEWLSHCAEAAVLAVDEETWHFAHNQVREQIIAELGEHTLRSMHQRLAEAIESVYPDGEGQYAALAQHWEWAEERDKAFRWYKLAGEQSEEAYAPIKAIDYYQKALTLMSAGRKAARERVEIYTGLGKMLRWQTRFDEAADIYRSMMSEAEDLSDKVAQARALIGLGDVVNSQGDRQGALEYAQQAEIIARETGEKAQTELVEALGNKAWGQYRLKQYDSALTTAQEGLDAAKQPSLRGAVGRNLNTLGIVNFMVGNYEQSEDYMRQAVEIARELGDKRDVAVKLNNLGEMRRLRGDSEGAISFLKDALNGFREIGYRDNELALLNNLGAVYVDLREFKAAEDHLRQVVKLTDGKDWWGLYETYLNLAEATFAQSNLAEATFAAQRALAEGGKVEDKTITGKAWRILAQISARLGMYMEIDGKNISTSECFERSVACFTEQDPERAHTLLKWAIYEYDFGDNTKANTLFHDAAGLYTALGMPEEAERIRENWLPGAV